MCDYAMKRMIYILVIVFVLSAVGCQAKADNLKISDIAFEFIFGKNPKEPNNIYCLLGKGFFRAPSAENTDSLISDWIENHPNATIVPVSSINNPEFKIIYCWVIAKNDNLNIYLVKNGCFSSGTMERPETWDEMEEWEKELYSDIYEKPDVEIYVSDKTYNDFIEEVKKAEIYAQDNEFGIWKNTEIED